MNSWYRLSMSKDVIIPQWRKKLNNFYFWIFTDILNYQNSKYLKWFWNKLQQLCKVRGWPEGDANYVKAKTQFMTMWDVLRKRCYKEDNERVIWNNINVNVDETRWFTWYKWIWFGLVLDFPRRILPTVEEPKPNRRLGKDIHGHHVWSSGHLRLVASYFLKITKSEKKYPWIFQFFKCLVFLNEFLWAFSLVSNRYAICTRNGNWQMPAYHLIYNTLFIGDNVIDEDEFVGVCQSYGIDSAECRAAFQTFSHVQIYFYLFLYYIQCVCESC